MREDSVGLKEELRGFFELLVEYARRIVYTIRSAELEDLWITKYDLSSFYLQMSALFRELAEFVEAYIKAVSKFLALFYELALIVGVTDIQEALFGDVRNKVNEEFLNHHVRSTVNLFLSPLDEYFSEAVNKLKVLVKAQRLLKSETIRRFKEEAYFQAAEWARIRRVLLDVYTKALSNRLRTEDFIKVLQEMRNLAGGAFIRLSAMSKLDAERYLMMGPELVVEEIKGFADKMAVLFENEEKIYFAIFDILNYVMVALWGDEMRDEMRETFAKVVMGKVGVDSLVPKDINFDDLLFAVNMARLELEQIKETLSESEELLPSFSTIVELLESKELRKTHEYYVRVMRMRKEYWPKIYDALLSLQGKTVKIVKK